MTTRQSLRKLLRQKRRALGDHAQQVASHQLLKQLRTHLWFRKSRHIALYLANDGEIDPTRLAYWCRQQGKILYLPVLHPFRYGELAFYPWHPNSTLVPNRFGIPEPERTPHRPMWALDLILLPLVGFDANGNRMGMGGGFYDRTLSTLPRHPGSGPRLIGLAHECQRVDRLPVESWDIPLHGIQSDRRFYACNTA